MNDSSYPIYKGLQLPLVFMGLQGRYIFWAAGGIIGGIIAFVIVFVTSSFLIAILTLIIILGVTFTLIRFKQKKGLHSKNIRKGVFITTNIFK